MGQPNRDWVHVRWVALALAIGLLTASFVLRIQPDLLPKSWTLASDMFGKVGIVLLCMWLAWPAIEMMVRAPSGTMFVAAGLFSVGLFLYNRKTIYITGPLLVAGIASALMTAWLKKKLGR
jgi:hypothetical protein